MAHRGRRQAARPDIKFHNGDPITPEDAQASMAGLVIRQRPGEPWSVDSLADVAQTSRSAFSERFTSVVGVPPARYLTRWHMQVATRWLRNDRVTVAEVGARLA